MKKKLFGLLSLTISLSLVGCSTSTKENVTKESTQTKISQKSTKKSSANEDEVIASSSSSEVGEVNLAGEFYDSAGNSANIELIDKNNWKINYSTLDGNISATFDTKWIATNQLMQSETPMLKSDKNSDFDILVEYINPSEITIKMKDGNPAHEMIFTRQKPAIDETYDVVLDGDLTPFAGQLSNDTFNQSIADSGFTLGGYAPDDYYNNKTTVFPTISKNGYWNGLTSHGSYEVIESDLPQKVDGYFEVHVHGVNAGANNQTLTFFLVPPKIKAFDGTVSDDRRVFAQNINGTQLLEYQKEDWWINYQSQ